MWTFQCYDRENICHVCDESIGCIKNVDILKLSMKIIFDEDDLNGKSSSEKREYLQKILDRYFVHVRLGIQATREYYANFNLYSPSSKTPRGLSGFMALNTVASNIADHIADHVEPNCILQIELLSGLTELYHKALRIKVSSDWMRSIDPMLFARKRSVALWHVKFYKLLGFKPFSL